MKEFLKNVQEISNAIFLENGIKSEYFYVNFKNIEKVEFYFSIRKENVLEKHILFEIPINYSDEMFVDYLKIKIKYFTPLF